jgi:Ca-activated chloride channel homolog
MMVRLTLFGSSLLMLISSLSFHGRLQNATQPQQGSEVMVPNRPSEPVYKNQQGIQRSEIEFTPSTRRVTIKLRVEDPNGYFLPNIRPENFAVYEDGVRQMDVTVDIEHASIVAAFLMEFGGRFQELNKALALEVPEIGRQFLDAVGPSDKVAILKYDDKVHVLADFTSPSPELSRVFDQLAPPNVSETNLHDALLETLQRLNRVAGRRAIILASSGVDTFSKADSERVIGALAESNVPIYSIGLVRIMQREATLYGPGAPVLRIDWKAAENDLESFARASGGRAYVLDSDVQLPAIYDDLMENLRIRYAISYVSSNPATSGAPRKIRVELIDPKTNEPLKFRDTSGKPVTAKIYVQASYSPDTPGN